MDVISDYDGYYGINIYLRICLVSAKLNLKIIVESILQYECCKEFSTISQNSGV